MAFFSSRSLNYWILRPEKHGNIIVEVTEFNSEVTYDLRGCLEAAMASEATKMAVRGNMHMDTRVVEVTEFNFEVRCDLRGRLEATMASDGNLNGC